MKPLKIFASLIVFIFLVGIVAFSFIERKTVPIKEVKASEKGGITKTKTIDKIGQIPVPQGYSRKQESSDSFGYYLRNILLKPKGSPVKLYSGEYKNYQQVHYRVLDISVGKRDLQQCADAVMRLRAEYLLNTNQKDKISFNYTSGDAAIYQKWATGYRPTIKGNKVSWSLKAKADTSYSNFLKYMDNVFMYAGSASLSKELKSKKIQDIEIGDVLIQGGFPGHAVLVVDVAMDSLTNKKIFLLAQSYMPAQDIHILKNFNNETLSPWYEIPSIPNENIITPEWIFSQEDLKTFE
ncbi:DUF4846 domain-containing protein [Bernardetia sp.]|uniref:DUF4846 domain-containing protein n=1 Tax=Bernardetia sp. TaxID=1937974 RepID=UPI0025BB4612|nr:DUF4846 domain-containing protein [Bernardetia sp.]